MSDLAGWEQVVAIIATGAGAICVANRQLTAYVNALKSSNKNERFRNSIKAVGDDLRQQIELHGHTFSPMEAASWVVAISHNPSQSRRFLSYKNRLASGDSSAANDASWIAQTKTAITIATTYFLEIGMLLDRKLVDTDYVMTRLAGMIIDFYDAATALKLDIQGSGALERFANWARSTRQVQRDRSRES